MSSFPIFQLAKYHSPCTQVNNVTIFLLFLHEYVRAQFLSHV